MSLSKRDYFLLALKHGADKKREWVNRVFSQVIDDPQASLTPDYPCRIKTMDGVKQYHFVDVNDMGKTEPIDGTTTDKVLFRFDEPLVINPGEFVNYSGTEPLVTTYGRALVNHLCLVYPFGFRMEYINDHFDIDKIEAKIYDMLIDDPEEDSVEEPVDKIFVRSYLQFCDNALSLVAYNSLVVTSVSPKALVANPKAKELRKQLVKQNADRLTDPSVIAHIGKELEQLDREWLKGDDTEKYYAVKDKKLYGAVRKKMFYLFGGESPFQDSTNVEFIEKSLNEGIDIDKLPTLINSLRYGSYNRGAQTQLGGESTKTIYRMLGTVRITEDDCGSDIGIPIAIRAHNYKDISGLSVIENGVVKLLDDVSAKTYIGKVVQLRSPLTCKTDGRNVCGVCMGKLLSEQPQGLAAAAAGLGGRFLSLFLKKMHASELATERWNIEDRLS